MIGIIQGRLSPKRNGKIQSFPLHSWKNEFRLASECGFQCLEWIVEKDQIENNPLFSEEGKENILSLSKKYSLKVSSICADVFMEVRLFSSAPKEQTTAKTYLKQLIHHASQIDVRTILLPLLETSALETPKDEHRLINALREVSPLLAKNNITLGLETSLSAPKLLSLIQQIDDPFVQVYYDIGNAASFGFNTEEEITQLASHIRGVHVKDRLLNGKSLPFGSGAVDFEKTFQALKDTSYSGSYILQMARGENDVEVATRSLNFVTSLLSSSLSTEKRQT